MAKATVISNLGARTMLNAFTALFDAGAGAGYVDIYAGAKPADVSVAIGAQTKLATVTLGDPAFAAATDAAPGATASANSITGDTSVDASGTAAFFRAYDSNGVAIIDGTCGTADADMILSTVTLVLGGTFNVTAWVLSLAEAA